MNFIEQVDSQFLIALTVEELSILICSLSQVGGGMASLRPENYLPLIGATKGEMLALKNALIKSRQDWLATSEHADNITIALSTHDLHICVRAMVEISYGISIHDPEFHTIVGHKRETVRKLLNEMHPLLVNLGKYLAYLRGMQ